MYSRYNVGWPCGVHADWTALHECVNKKMRNLEGRNKRKYYYVTEDVNCLVYSVYLIANPSVDCQLISTPYILINF